MIKNHFPGLIEALGAAEQQMKADNLEYVYKPHHRWQFMNTFRAPGKDRPGRLLVSIDRFLYSADDLANVGEDLTNYPKLVNGSCFVYYVTYWYK